MMRVKNNLAGLPPLTTADPNSAGAAAAGAGDEAAGEWEMRPGGMLVQKRDDSDQNAAAPLTIRVRVKFGSIYHEISISSQATFGELKRKLTEATGLHHEDQKLLFKNKPRDSKAYLDISGVKDRSKLVVMEDPISQEKRLLEMRRTAKVERAAKAVSAIALEVDRLAGMVSAFESVISKGGKVAEKDLVNVIELLMNELIKLDAIVADGDVKLQRKMQVKRVQKYVETLDMLKTKNSTPTSEKKASQPPPQPAGRQSRRTIGVSPLRPKEAARPQINPAPPETVVTTLWETFDSNPAAAAASPPPLIPLSPTAAAAPAHSNNHKFNWEFFE